MQHYVIKFVSDLWQVGGFLQYPPLSDCHNIFEILLKVPLNTITLTLLMSIKILNYYYLKYKYYYIILLLQIKLVLDSSSQFLIYR